ncbi:unnamed protein product [Ambrosiozyma monospora]|uniref:Unnamed protein product n=1 Tax=Ambrosiozyma monospora TaxID=43982 RepID=A0ACB5T3A0_AMBMO|nr:unnamed protein product [Ambrosiozyma monospora]
MGACGSFKKKNAQDFELFNWTLHLFRQKPKVKVDAFEEEPYYEPRAKCQFVVISSFRVVLEMEMKIYTPQTRFLQTFAFEKLAFDFSFIDFPFIKSLIRLNPSRLIVKFCYPKKMEGSICQKLTGITCDAVRAPDLNTMVSQFERLSDVEIVKVPSEFDLAQIKTLLQSTTIRRFSLCTDPDIDFECSSKPESKLLLKKFENKLELHAKYVYDLPTLKFAQRARAPEVAILDSEDPGILSDVQVKHAVLTSPLGDYAPENDKIKHLDLTAETYELIGANFSKLTNLKSFSVGSQKHMGFKDRLLTPSFMLNIATGTLRSLPMSIRALDLSGCQSFLRNPTLYVPETVEFLRCTPDQLATLSIKSTKNVKSLTLKECEWLSEPDPCCNHLPTNINITHLSLEGGIYDTDLYEKQVKRPPLHPRKQGGMTIQKRVKSNSVLVLDGLKILFDEDEDEPLSLLHYYTINYKESHRYNFNYTYYTDRDTFFNIRTRSESVRLEIYEGNGRFIISNG